jgi:hypothetical protein
MNNMRKLISCLALTVFATSACAQGVITFANSVITPNTPYVLNGYTSQRLVGTQYAAQLYYGASQTSLAAHTAAPNRFRAPGSSLAGTWSTATGANRTLNGGGVGVPVFAQVRVWDLDQFATYEAAVAGGGNVGTSPIFQYIQRLSTPTPSVTDTYMTDPFGNPFFTSFYFGVPEPSVGLLAIPALALVAWQYRRRRVLSFRN